MFCVEEGSVSPAATWAVLSHEMLRGASKECEGKTGDSLHQRCQARKPQRPTNPHPVRRMHTPRRVSQCKGKVLEL